MPGILSAPREWLESSPTRWYVVFCEDEGRRYWWRATTRAGFRHVYALRWDGWNWLLFNPSAEYTEVAIIAVSSEDALGRLVPPGAKVLEVEAFRQRDRIRGRWWIGPMTCVEQIKGLLGLPVGFIWTPWQLYRYLLGCVDGVMDQEVRFPQPHQWEGGEPAGDRQNSPEARSDPAVKSAAAQVWRSLLRPTRAAAAIARLCQRHRTRPAQVRFVTVHKR